MSMTIEQVLAARKAKREATKSKGSQLHGYLADIVTLLNGGALWVDILEYLEANGVRTIAGNSISRSYLIDFCTLHVPPYDVAVGSTEAVVAKRAVALTGAGKYARKIAEQRAALANGHLPPASVAPAVAECSEATVTEQPGPAAQRVVPESVPGAPVVGVTRAKIANPLVKVGLRHAPPDPRLTPEYLAGAFARLSKADDALAMAKATGKF